MVQEWNLLQYSDDLLKARGETHSKIISVEKGSKELLKKHGVKFPVDGWLDAHKGVNKPLNIEDFTRCLLPKLSEAARLRREQNNIPEPSCGQCYAIGMSCRALIGQDLGSQKTFDKLLCEDIFRTVDQVCTVYTQCAQCVMCKACT